MQYDIKQIQADFNKIIAATQGIESPQTDDLFNRWAKSKKKFIEKMGGQLTIEIPNITFELNSDEKKRMVDDFLDWIYNYLDNEELYFFLDREIEGFFTNEVVQEYSYAPEKTIPKGMKLIKAFKYFEDNQEILETIQNRASMIIQENKISGTLCLSVHPLDYLTISENSYNWRSCHALDGEFKAGNLSYMVDKSTIICYLKGNDKIYYPEVEWNSKKWRMLLYFSDNWDIIFAGRPYPFSSPNALETIREELFEHFIEGPRFSWTSWRDDYIDKFYWKEEDQYEYLNHHICVSNKLYDINTLVINEYNSCQFNDVTDSSHYHPFYMWNKWSDGSFLTHVGGEVKCLRCGAEPITTPDTMMCADCECEYGFSEDESYLICDCCGRRYLYLDSYWVSNDDRICPTCRKTQTDTCWNCGRLHYKDELTIDRETNKPICDHCKERLYGC